jgi:hypothetical protein
MFTLVTIQFVKSTIIVTERMLDLQRVVPLRSLGVFRGEVD